jgi:hypothetical protein
MVNIDLSKAFPHRAFAYALAIVPGLFFEFAVAVGNPSLVASIELTPKQFMKLSPYLEVIGALVFAFLIGNLAMDSVAMIQLALRRLLIFKAHATLLTYRRIFFPLTARLINRPPWNQRRFVVAAHVYCSKRSYPDDRDAHLARKCWDVVSKKLLLDKYGVAIDDVDNEWQHLFWNLGEVTMVDRRGDILVMALHASAWCGVAAAWIAPRLRNRYFLAFCGLAFLIGLTHDYDVARRLSDPVSLAHARIRAVLRQYKWPKTSATSPPTT